MCHERARIVYLKRILGSESHPEEVSTPMSQENEYVLGTHDAENARLLLQHRIWRPRALDAWRRAGFTVGQMLLDVGCGPGHAAVDLAEIVGPAGRIVAIDCSRRFLDTLEATRRHRGLDQITPLELDLNVAGPPPGAADGAWARWIFAFVQHPRELLARIREALKPGGVLVIHEYFDYRTWRLAPRAPEIEEFVQAAMASWRAAGGEPDIGLALPGWLAELGFTTTSLRPILDVVPASNFVWQWPAGYIRVGLARLVELGQMPAERARVIADVLTAREADPHTLMVTPALLELIAVRQ